jgi:hypothetical protein
MAESTWKNDLRLYKPQKNGQGSASQWEYRVKDKIGMMFVTLAPQLPGKDQNGNDKFDWDEGKIIAKLGQSDIGELLATVERRMDSAGGDRGLFHKTPGGGNKIITLKKSDRGYYFGMSSKPRDAKEAFRLGHSVSHGEASLLAGVLRGAIDRMFF